MEQRGSEAVANRVLAALSPEALKSVTALMKPVILTSGRVLYCASDRMDKIYFMNRGLISSVWTMEDGRTVEVGAVGIEGIVGALALFGSETTALEYVVQIPGAAFCCNTDDLQREMRQNRDLADLLQRYFYLTISQIAQTSACNSLHKIEQRCCRWLLTAHDGARSDEFQLTHELLAMMLGVQRASVSLAANALQQAGYIQYARGQITITDRGGLEASVCECYGTIRQLYDRLFPYWD